MSFINSRKFGWAEIGLLALTLVVANLLGLSLRKTIGLVILMLQIIAPLPVAVWGWVALALVANVGWLVLSGATAAAGKVVEYLFFVVIIALFSFRSSPAAKGGRPTEGAGRSRS